MKEQTELGKYLDCFEYSKKAIKHAESQERLSLEEQKEYFELLLIAMDVTYRLRKIEDMLKIS